MSVSTTRLMSVRAAIVALVLVWMAAATSRERSHQSGRVR